MTLKQALEVALAQHDVPRIARIVDRLRELGCTYPAIFNLAAECSPGLEMSDWDDLMVEADELEAAS